MHPETKRWIYAYTRRYGRPRVLDYGCGAGGSVRELLAEGYDVWGADIDTEAIAGQDLLGAVVDGRTPYEEHSFDFVFSEQVFEHVANLDVVAHELARVTKPGGWNFHVFPAHRSPYEAHLQMPLVHWLPKNGFRRAAITVFHRMGVEPPHPPQLPSDADWRVKSEFQYRYSCEQTFYRPYRRIAVAMRAAGFDVRSVTSDNRKLQRFPAVLRRVADLPVRTFASVDLLAIRI